MPFRPHVLVIGGTRMLRGVSLHLAQDDQDVSVIARSHPRLSTLAADAPPGGIHPIPLDYTDANALAAHLRAAVIARGPISLVVCWIHSNAPDAPSLVADMVANERDPCRFFHVIGSSAGDPTRTPDPYDHLARIPGVAYRRVVLGFVFEQGASRWLSDVEIVAGVVRAVESDADETVIGVTGPWSARPS